MAQRLLFWSGVLLVMIGALLLLLTPVPASTGRALPAAIYLGFGTLALGFLNLASSHYFKLRDARRADRAEEREIAVSIGPDSK